MEGSFRLYSSTNPDKIGINISEHYGIADGLAKTIMI